MQLFGNRRTARRTAAIALAGALTTLGIGLIGPAQPASAAALTWTPIAAPTPSGAELGTVPTFFGSDCPGAGMCFVVGNQSGSPMQPLVEALSDGSWIATEPPLPSGMRGGQLTSISCTSTTSCVAVGYALDSDGSSTALVETLGSHGWAGSLPPIPAGAHLDSDGYPFSELASVSCVSTACQAVGFAYAEGPEGSYQMGVISSDSSGGWTSIPAPAPSGAGSPDDDQALMTFASVSCVSATECEAVGQVEDDNGYDWGLIEQLSNSIWMPSFAAEPSNTGTDDDGFQNATLSAVSCEPGGTCVAAGYYITTSGGVYDDSMLDTTTFGPSGTTTSTEAPMPGGSVGTNLKTISCASDGTCAAGGYAYIATTVGDNTEDLQYALAETNSGSGGAWVDSQVPVPSNAGTGANQQGELTAVACSTGGSCQAAGYYQDTATNAQMFRGLLESFASGTWSGIETPQPSNAGTDADYEQYTQLNAISCASSTACVAAGRYDTQETGATGLFEVSGTPTPPKPTITKLSPSSGPSSGGTKVTITGTNLTGATAVSFGGTNGKQLSVTSATSLTVTSPAHAASKVSVTVTATGGTSGAASFTFIAAPTVKKVSPTKGSDKGGTTVTVTGTGFTGVTKVEFGTVKGKSVHVVSSTKVTVKSPAHAKGRVNVRVVASGGTSKSGTGNRFTYT